MSLSEQSRKLVIRVLEAALYDGIPDATEALEAIHALTKTPHPLTAVELAENFLLWEDELSTEVEEDWLRHTEEDPGSSMPYEVSERCCGGHSHGVGRRCKRCPT